MEQRQLDDWGKAWSRVLREADASTVVLSALLTVLAREHDQFHSSVLRRFKITHAEYVVLATLRVMEPPRSSPKHLGRTVRQTTAGITRTVDRLERAGLVARTPAPGDRRSLFVELTPAGVAMAERLVRVEMVAHEALLKSFAPTQRRQLREALRLLGEAYDAHRVARSATLRSDQDGQHTRKRRAVL